jgi:hypothetical protein
VALGKVGLTRLQVGRPTNRNSTPRKAFFLMKRVHSDETRALLFNQDGGTSPWIKRSGP